MVLLIAVIVAATKPPDKVQGLEVKNTSYNSVSLSWEKTENTSRYSIMRAEDGKTYECIDTTKDTSFVDNHLETGKTYTYKVESNNGIKKTESTKKVNATPALDVPKIKSDISEGKAEISITNVEGAEGYKVYRDNKEIEVIQTNPTAPVIIKDVAQVLDDSSSKEKNDIPKIVKEDSIQFIDTTAEANKDYTYEVKAYRNEAESKSSKPVNLELISAGDINAKIRGDEVILSWDNDTYNSYKVYNGDELIAETEQKSVSLPADKEKYNIKVIGYNDEMQSPESVRNFTIEEEPMDNAGAIQAAIDWAIDIANDDSFAYGKKPTTNRIGCYFCGTNQRNKPKGYEKTYVCMTFVTAAYAHGAQDPEVLSVCRRGKMCLSLTDSNFSRFSCWKKVGLCKNLSVSDLQPGDVLVWYDDENSCGGHMSMYIGDGDICDASGGGWDADSISVKHGAARSYLNYRGNDQSSQNYVMRYTGKGSGTMKVIKDI